jgi:Leu/Phe-tRNA-protein transferase
VNELETLLVDELRREFRRTRPPAKALQSAYRAGIFRLTDTSRTGFRIFWYRSDLLTVDCFTVDKTLFELIEPLEL